MAEQKKTTETGAHVGTPETPPQFEDSDEVIVLYGFGRVHPRDVEYVDGYRFVGGVGRDIPYAVARCWQKGVRMDGTLAPSKIKIQAILPANATENDFIRATGITPMPFEQLAALLSAADPEQIIAAMGTQQAKVLADTLRSRLQARQAARS